MFDIQVKFDSCKFYLIQNEKCIFSLKQFLLYMSEGSLPFCGILLMATVGFLHVSGSHKSLIFVDSSFFFDLCPSEKSKKGWGCIILVKIHFLRTIYQPYFPLRLFPDRKQKYTISVEWKKSCFVFLTVLSLLGPQGGRWHLSQLHRREGKVQVFSYPLFLTDSKWDPSCDPLSHGPSMCCDDCTISVAIWRMCGR